MDVKNILWIVYLIAYSWILDEEIIVKKNDEHALAFSGDPRSEWNESASIILWKWKCKCHLMQTWIGTFSYLIKDAYHHPESISSLSAQEHFRRWWQSTHDRIYSCGNQGEYSNHTSTRARLDKGRSTWHFLFPAEYSTGGHRFSKHFIQLDCNFMIHS